ncbi:Carnitine monooxygenase oxygenase subunit [Lachnellula arida]|uniref:Carnitine monooxygenase oxygenase subunit n=1 Tax=Lachnellula arida TaxID=1316785 RepID=A0A8T9B4V7_9HELO|nr:Carnitine monooxygenase oxygenase subunit [Lachnellula arida]
MARLEPTLYSVAVGFLVLAGYLVRYYHFNIPTCKSPPVLLSWLGEIWGKEQDKTLGDTLVQPLDNGSDLLSSCSSDWWEDDGLFQLEKRAIFSKSWLYVTHACRFQKPGDYRTFEIAGFSIIVIQGKDHRLRAFQNVCRHRAYQVTKKECGSSTVLGCRYHGWSYDTKGMLVKAPEFENVPDFDKSKNALWEVKTEVINSLVFINFDASGQVTSVGFRNSLKPFKTSKTKDMRCAVDWKVECQMNWKLAAGYFSFDSSSHRSMGTTMFSLLPAIFSTSQKYESIGNSAVIRQLSSGDFLTLRFLPKSPRTTTVECCLYTKRAENRAAELLTVKKEVREEIEQMEKKQRRLLNGEIGSFRPKQDELRQILKMHAEKEARSGMEIHPAAQKHDFTEEGRADDDFCRELDNPSNDKDTVCSASAKGLLDW